MTEIPIVNSTPPLPLQKVDNSEVTLASKGFSDIFNSMVDQVNSAEMDSNKAIEKVNTGEAKNLHDVMLAVEEADLSLRMLVQMRNKALEAYETIMRLQI